MRTDARILSIHKLQFVVLETFTHFIRRQLLSTEQIDVVGGSGGPSRLGNIALVQIASMETLMVVDVRLGGRDRSGDCRQGNLGVSHIDFDDGVVTNGRGVSQRLKSRIEQVKRDCRTRGSSNLCKHG